MILPFVKPLIGAFSHQASLYGILSAYQETLEWRHCNYIQLYTLKELAASGREGTIDFYFNPYGDFSFFEHFTNPFLRSNRILRATVLEKWRCIDDYVFERLNAGEYVYIAVNTKFVFGLNYDRYHPVILYGHINGKTLLGYDNHPNGFYDKISIHESILTKCFSIPPEIELKHVRLEGIITHSFRMHDDEHNKTYHSFQLHKLINDLSDYLCPKRDVGDIYVYGVDCYDSLVKYVIYVLDCKSEHLDKRAVSSLLDHKALMLSRIEYLQNKFHFCSSFALQYQNDIWKAVRNTQLLFIKYTYSHKVELLTRIIERLHIIKKAEYDLLTQLLQMLLEKYVNYNNI